MTATAGGGIFTNSYSGVRQVTGTAAMPDIGGASGVIAGYVDARFASRAWPRSLNGFDFLGYIYDYVTVPSQDIAPALFDDSATDTFFAPTITVGSVTLTPSLY